MHWQDILDHYERKKMKILILDDDTERHAGFQKILAGNELAHAYTYSEFVGLARSGAYDMVCLDHDLGFEHAPDTVREDGVVRELTGQDAARWLVNNPNHCPDNILIHSHNPVGASAMRSILAALPGKKIVVRAYTPPR